MLPNEKLIWQRKDLLQTFSSGIISASDVQRVAMLCLQFLGKDMQGKHCCLIGPAVGMEVADIGVIELPIWSCTADRKVGIESSFWRQDDWKFAMRRFFVKNNLLVW